MSDIEIGNTTEIPAKPKGELTHSFFFTVAMLHDISKDRYHPIVYKPKPQPSWTDGDMIRSQSMGHHTTGFDTHDEALKSANELIENMREQIESGEGNLSLWASKVYPCLDKSFPWEGGDASAAGNNFFALDEDEKVFLIM